MRFDVKWYILLVKNNYNLDTNNSNPDINHTNFFLYEFQLHYLLKSNLIEKETKDINFLHNHLFDWSNLNLRITWYFSVEKIVKYL